jgi:hypothetical protein
VLLGAREREAEDGRNERGDCDGDAHTGIVGAPASAAVHGGYS